MIAIGRRVYGLGAIALGVPLLILGDFAAVGAPVPPHLAGYHPLAWACAALLILAGLGLQLRRTAALAALALTAFFALWLLLLPLPHALAKPMEWVSWEDVAERTVMILGGLLAWAGTSAANPVRAAALGRFIRPAFGLCLMAFAVSEFVYAKFTAALVPAWLPPSQLVWAYVTGAAQMAAGLAVVSGIRARLAAVLLTAMYLIFTLIVHLPRVFAAPTNAGALAENGTNLVLAGAAWMLAESLSRVRPQTQD